MPTRLAVGVSTPMGRQRPRAARRARAAGATMPKLVSPQKVWSSVTLSCPNSTMTIFPSPCSHTTIPPSPIYETIDESFASEPVYESGSIYNHNHDRGKVTRAERPPLDSVKGCQRPFRSLKEPQGRPQSSIPRLVVKTRFGTSCEISSNLDPIGNLANF